MKKLLAALKRFFLPPLESKTIVRILPLVAIAFLMILIFAVATYAWEESNSNAFCGLTCHTMPPEYATHQESVHAIVYCEDCHMGRDRLNVLIGRKVRYSWQTGTAMLLNTYEYPIVAKNMAPARQACENCHKPEVFSNDTLIEIPRFAADETNTSTTTYLVVKTGGGTSRQGLGYGIHWHIENPVLFYATDERQQEIPYVVVENPDGTRTEYVDIETGFDAASIDESELVVMDCITCHNRTAHLVDSPKNVVDKLLNRGLVSKKIPFIKQKAVEVLSGSYASEAEANAAIAELAGYYQSQQAEFYAQNSQLISDAVTVLQAEYAQTNFPDQKVDWQTHPDNTQHVDSPGCFRCHDGKHLNTSNESVRLECNLCHSIPVIAGQDDFVSNIEISRGPEPASHKDTNWINLHRSTFDETCAGCHSIDDPGGVSNTSFCSNSACHGVKWEFAGFDAPRVREILGLNITPTPAPTRKPSQDQEPTPAAPTPSAPTPTAGSSAGNLTYEASIAPILTKCLGCHGDGGQKGVNLKDYASVMAGGEGGPNVAPGDPESSLLVSAQSQAQPHFMQLSDKDLQTIIDWILAGAPEK